MNFILFGPPGVGKSTLIGQLKTKGQKAIDLEDVYPNNLRFELPTVLDGVVFGGADLDPQGNYGANVRKILITFKSQEQYDRQRAIRDSRVPGKSQQAKHLLSDWEQGDWYDYKIVIPGSNENASMTAGRIVSVMRKMRTLTSSK